MPREAGFCVLRLQRLIGQEGLMVILHVLASPFALNLPQFLVRQETCLAHSKLLTSSIYTGLDRCYVTNIAISRYIVIYILCCRSYAYNYNRRWHLMNLFYVPGARLISLHIIFNFIL